MQTIPVAAAMCTLPTAKVYAQATPTCALPTAQASATNS
jgi:hypothetical protein